MRLALQTMRSRRRGFVGAFVALTFAVAIMTACGILIESGARARPSVERYARVPVIVAGEQTIAVDRDGQVETERVPERSGSRWRWPSRWRRSTASGRSSPIVRSRRPW